MGGGSGPPGCVQNTKMARAGARASQTATGVTGINSSGVSFFFCFLFFLPFFAIGHTSIHRGIHRILNNMFQKVSPQG